MSIVPARTTLATLACVLAACMPAGAAPPQSVAPPMTDPSPVALADEPFHMESIGLTMRLPEGATAQATMMQGTSTAQIAAENGYWVISITPRQTANKEASITEALEQTRSLIQGAVGVVDPAQKNVLSTEARIIESTDRLQIGEQPAARLYVSLPSGGKVRTVKGYTIFKPQETQFVIFELTTTEPEFEKARRLYETTIATALFADPAVLTAARGAAVRAGLTVLEAVRPEDYDALLDGVERWYRFYQPAASGAPADAQELGYRGVTFWKGRRGEVDPARSRDRWNGIDQQEGYLARLRVRLIVEGSYIDSDGAYFMSPDRADEAWLLKTTTRDSRGKQVEAYSETAVRSKADMTIVVEGTRQAATTIRPLMQNQGKGYLSQFDSYLIPRLLVRANLEGVEEFGFYTYRSFSRSIALRRETLTRDASGSWTLKTLFREDLPPRVAVLNDKGEALSVDEGEGRIWKPIEPAELARLWERKGLPVQPFRTQRGGSGREGLGNGGAGGGGGGGGGKKPERPRGR